PFEALACGIPLISAPWQDTEALFHPGQDFLVAETGAAMQQQLQRVLSDRSVAQALSQQGQSTIRSRHTCAHRVDELLDLYAQLQGVEPGAVQLEVGKQEVAV
ncbi:MAG TPA: glycosyltransferase, partial [Coleofasciculaceae cyanobacterium]